MISTPPPPSFVTRGASPSMIRRAVDRRGLAVFGAATAAALLASFVLLFAIWARTRVTQAGYDLAAASREHQQLLRERESLQYKVAKLKSPQRLRDVAARLGMGVAPASRTIVLVGSREVKSPDLVADIALQGTRSQSRDARR